MFPAAETLLRLYRDVNAVEAAISLMNWDRQALMPPGGSEARTAHVTILARRSHTMITSDEMARALETVHRDAEPGSDLAAMAKALRREVEIETKLPADLVDRKTRIGSEAYENWKAAKANNDFPRLAPYLEALFEIAGETAECLGYKDNIYDPLIDLFDEGSTVQSASAMFDEIKAPIVGLVNRIRSEGRPVDDRFLHGDWDKEALRGFAERTIAAIGFDMNRGRLDIAPSAFCMNLSCDDVRMTTRSSHHVKGIVSSSLHEMGHALYEQNSPKKWDLTPLAGGVSLAIHESQSRGWENIVGRSKGFWARFLPDLQSAMPSLAGISADDFYRAINKVEPEFIRVGADELTYNLHILVRFELEVAILTGKTRVRDLPEAWNAKYAEYLGITPPTDTLGCLQDVHWSRGAIGYFPTYAMGNMIGGQIWARLRRDVPEYESLIESGNFAPILGWLVEHIYSRARSVTPQELMVEVTGRPMSPHDWLEYATEKYSEIYCL